MALKARLVRDVHHLGGRLKEGTVLDVVSVTVMTGQKIGVCGLSSDAIELFDDQRLPAIVANERNDVAASNPLDDLDL